MVNGELFNITGYDINASANSDFGATVVLNNNSTHFLVAQVDMQGDDIDAQGKRTTLYNTTARLIGSFEYRGEHDVKAAYALALHLMTTDALEHTGN